MGFAENVLNKVRGTPIFKPASVDSFGNWAIEAGDVITVENDGATEHIPIFSSDMNWNGSAKTTMSCTGNQKREIQDKQTRKDNVMSNSLSRYADRRLDELADSFGVELGNVRSALDVYVKDTEEYKEANTTIVASIDENVSLLNLRVTSVKEEVDGKISTIETAQNSLTAKVTGAEASIELNAKNINGVSSSVATLQANVIKLQGDVNVGGNLTLTDGNIIALTEIIAAHGLTIGTDHITIYGKDYKPTEITSTSGTVRVLGIA